MSALPDEPAHFLDWIRARDPAAQPGTFASRRLYGDYLEELLRSAAHGTAARIELIRDEAVDLGYGQGEKPPLVIRTASGRILSAERVVLALGHLGPQALPGLEQPVTVPEYISDPWGSSPLEGVGVEEPIALIGSGLTAVDVVVEALERGHVGMIHAISRHGLLPCRHRPVPAHPHFQLGGSVTTARALLSAVRAKAARCESQGGDWRSVVDSIRPVAQSLWRSLATGERKRFIRHVAPRWDIHRHRVAPEIDDLLQAARRDRRLVVTAGRVLTLQRQDGQVVLTLRRRGRTDPEDLAVRRVINCTGPGKDIRVGMPELLRSLFASGLGRPGPLAIGLDVTDSGSIVGQNGHPHDRIFAIGPLLKEQLWETTAVRELRSQAHELARRLLETASAQTTDQVA
jgi:uncharacterized NAD(P)/FAD-binding protein YdhS